MCDAVQKIRGRVLALLAPYEAKAKRIQLSWDDKHEVMRLKQFLAIVDEEEKRGQAQGLQVVAEERVEDTDIVLDDEFPAPEKRKPGRPRRIF
jgi:hypothetical protein